MEKRQGSVTRQGRVYHFRINETDYSAFVWQVGQQFRGRVEGNNKVPQVTGRTALAVRDALHAWLVSAGTPTI